MIEPHQQLSERNHEHPTNPSLRSRRLQPLPIRKGQLSKVDGWEGLITITDSKCCGEWTDFAKDSGVVATPTLVAFEGGEVVARQAGSQSFTSDFFRGLIEKFTSTITNE